MNKLAEASWLDSVHLVREKQLLQLANVPLCIIRACCLLRAKATLLSDESAEFINFLA